MAISFASPIFYGMLFVIAFIGYQIVIRLGKKTVKAGQGRDELTGVKESKDE